MLAFVFFGLELSLGALLLGTAAVVAPLIYQRQQTKSAQSHQRKEQQAVAEAQAEIAGERQAVAHAPISPEQMEFIMYQREIGNLINKFDEQDQTEPEIYTLPAMEPTGTLDRLNLLIQDIISK